MIPKTAIEPIFSIGTLLRKTSPPKSTQQNRKIFSVEVLLATGSIAAFRMMLNFSMRALRDAIPVRLSEKSSPHPTGQLWQNKICGSTK